MTFPPFLQNDDTVALVATGKKIEERFVDNARQHLESWGLRVIVGSSSTASHHQFAGNDDLRIADIQTQLDNPEVKAILCLRGGYGTVRVIDQLDFLGLKKHPKWIIGYSDVTVLQNHLQRHCDMASIHAEMPLNFPIFPKFDESLTALKDALFGNFKTFLIQPNFLQRMGVAEGKLVGGNLSILCSLLGSKSEVNTQGKLLFLEDVGEHLYALDRMLMTLKRAKKLENLAGLIVGQFTNLQDHAIPFGKTVYELIAEHVAAYHYPVLFDIPAGHCNPNQTLLYGATYAMKVEKDQTSLNIIFRQQ